MGNESSTFDKLKVFFSFAFIPLFAFVVTMVLPFLLGIFMTFTNSNGVSANFDFIGLENYIVAFSDEVFWSSLILTFEYVLYTLIFTNLIAFGLALIVTSGTKGQNTLRTSFFTPNLIGGLILGFIWQFVFSRVMVSLGNYLNLEIFSTSWLTEPDKAFWTLVIVSVWQSSGYMMLIYIAGIMSIPKSLIEAANIDGASKLQQLIRIKIPMMVTAFTISVFLTLQRSFVVYDVNLSLTGGGPFRTTELLSMHVYNEAFIYQNFGPGQAKAIILFIIVAVIALTQVVAMKKLEVES